MTAPGVGAGTGLCEAGVSVCLSDGESKHFSLREGHELLSLTFVHSANVDGKIVNVSSGRRVRS